MNTETESELLNVLERKIATGLRAVDDKTLEAVRSEWSGISPSPICSDIGSVMVNIRRACAAGLNERAAEAQRVISETLRTYLGSLSSDLMTSAKRVVETMFPADLYIGAARNTVDVFRRRQAPTSKFSNQRFEHEMSLLEVDIVNRRSRAVVDIHTLLDELALGTAPTPQIASLGTFWNTHWKWTIGIAVTIILGILTIVF